MLKARAACAVTVLVGVSQLILGIAFLGFPTAMYETMGIAVPSQGVNYILAMLSAWFLVYGAVMLMILRDLPRHRLWLDGMVAIQAIDFATGAFHVAAGAVPLDAAAFPMVNAAVFAIALLLVRPRPSAASALRAGPLRTSPLGVDHA
ncbi:hypothetical protein [Azospirillum canadense]|uniref:hypothetical protein n=1 Tax=Azospirillum canadense TaxID=403962 RepID=UPI002226C909|nr:hypothetical protein [Azospirillum canadense]MCW2237926.1 hypothetical protein [Azospirillum canadense]